MKKINGIFITLFVLMISACGSEGELIVDEGMIDFTGTWSGACELADTSLVPALDELYYFDTIEITETRISIGSSIFSDSDCISPFVADFARNTLFQEGEYTLGQRVETETGLTAFALQIQDAQSDATFDNIIALVDGTLYFGYSPIDGPADETPNPLTALDLDNGFREL